MKLRLLNAGHQVLGHLGRLAGLTYVHDACRDPLFRDLLVGYWRDEGVPTLRPVPGIDLAHYEHDLLERFGSAAVLDTLARLCTDASDRIPKFLLPVLRANLDSGREIRRAVLVLAAWARSFCGADDTGRSIEIVDARRDALAAAAARQDEDPLAFVRDPAVFGDLAADERFAAAYRSALHSLRERGTRATAAALAG
jgi:mannitol 2-dehydrogenase